jgi:predicted alpha/beta superfamily hydrolase
MKKNFALLLLLQIGVLFCPAQFKVTVKITVPGDVRADSFFVAGNINGWNPASPAYQFRPRDKFFSQGILLFSVPKPGTIDFKITRGNWNTVECMASGRDIANRSVAIESDTTIEIAVAAWKDAFAGQSQPSTASVNVSVLDTAFLMPQLNVKRTIRIYLPPGYQNSKQKYSVLYLHDGQNLFDEALNAFGEWGVDEYLDSVRKRCIIVGIDHGGPRRMQEYNPYNNASFGKGMGNAYLEFIVKTLKPYIDKTFRTPGNRASTFMAGSSMGAHISLYAALQYPQVFGKVGLFSPAFWVNMNEVQTEIKKSAKRKQQAFYIYAGGQESANLVKEVMQVFDALRMAQPGNRYKLSVKAAGKHNEPSWRNELPAFFEWLLQ